MIKKIDIKDICLETNRTRIKEFDHVHVASFETYFRDREFQKHILQRYGSANEAYENYQDEKKSNKLIRYYFAIEHKSDNKTIGALRIDTINYEESLANLHLELHPDYWGQELVTEAAEKLISWAFSTIELKKFRGSAHPKNIGSQKVLEKLGFSYSSSVEDYKGTGQPRQIYFLERVVS